ncbi:MAG: trimeric autotransporter adhesin [Nocardioidaceae bacterium]|nr:trimeric autotransporter adhesin [Nocardioidaceae bacterium]
MSARARWGIVGVGLAGLLLTSTAHVTAAVTPGAAPQPTVTQDFRYAGAADSPSGDKPQSKLWYAHGSWWGVLAAAVRTGPQGTRIYKLVSDHWERTGAEVDPRPDSTGDVLWDGRTLYVASRSPAAPLAVARFSFDRHKDTWSLDDGFPVRLGTGSESATIAEDSTRTLWVTYTSQRRVWVAHSTGDDRTWTAPFQPGADLRTSSDDISAVVSFDSKIGVMWSDQYNDEFHFAVHQDGDGDGAWAQEVASSGLASADDHIHLATIPSTSGTQVVAVVKTSLDDLPAVVPTANQIEVLVRAPDGHWRTLPAGTIQDGPTRPILVVDQSHRQLYVVSASWGAGIYYKAAPFDRLSFEGTWSPLMPPAVAPGIDNPTSSKSTVTSRTGMIVLASAQGRHRYFHATLPLPHTPADTSAPSAPVLLQPQVTSGCQVDLSWTQPTDNVAVTGYVVTRDGRHLTSTAGTAFTDASVDCGSTHRYTVSAVDAAGNASKGDPSATVTAPDAVHRGHGIWLRSVTTARAHGSTRVDLVAPPAKPGDLLLASISADGGAPDHPPPGWHLVRRSVAGKALTMATYVREAKGAPREYSWDVGGPRNAVVTLAVYAGTQAHDPVVVSSGQAGSTSAHDMTLPAVDVQQPGSAVVGFFSVAAKAALTTPPEMVVDIVQGDASNGKSVTAGSAELLDVDGPQRSMVAVSSRGGYGIGQVLVLRQP